MHDKHYDQLVSLLAKYDTLLDQLQQYLSMGYYNLSRANYHNKDAIRGYYGQDYWDATYPGTKLVDIKQDGTFSIDQVSNDSNDKKGASDMPTNTENVLRNRSEGILRQPEIERNLKPKDPIYMFGGLLSVPSSLRQSQSAFQRCIPLISELVNCRKALLDCLDGYEKSAGISNIR
ncbi:Vma22p Ecym_3210 [Eremothecium cymbalariae DBVPG|uniref:Vacuolar ATPase assembly protein VMA22 n=1 Tax=Eremothecium cymbalariae (strain CBS 270.75 / DBVPG 7215 / KCTC 17166 / NRRL Y-17582) TaxID=931890 RepID=G8JRD9_ERECY|nr:Hypothetical protein Ecym_3210 [Eremothecium cymbalariae DBVPG\